MPRRRGAPTPPGGGKPAAPAPLSREDAELLSRVLVWRVVRAAPRDHPPTSDVQARLKRSGRAFRRRVSPLTYREVAEAIRRLRHPLLDGQPTPREASPEGGAAPIS